MPPRRSAAAASTCLLLTLALSGCGTPASSTGTPMPTPVVASPSVSLTPVGGPHAVVYELDGSGTAQVSYTTGAATSPVQDTVTLPWTKTLRGSDAPASAVLTALLQSGTNLSCSISRDGAALSHAASSGLGATVRCTSSG